MLIKNVCVYGLIEYILFVTSKSGKKIDSDWTKFSE